MENYNNQLTAIDLNHNTSNNQIIANYSQINPNNEELAY